MTGRKARLMAYNQWQEADRAALRCRGRHEGAPAADRTPPRPSALAEAIAGQIESSVRFPAGHDGQVCRSICCDHCVRWRTAQAFAALARRIGGAT